MERKVLLRRNKQTGNGTFGILTVDNEYGKQLFRCYTLEPMWLGNQRGKSCIPTGTYQMDWEYSPKFDTMLWEFKDVPGRDEIKIHAGNYPEHTHGCILVGYERSDKMLWNSQDALVDFHDAMTEAQVHGATITIIEV